MQRPSCQGLLRYCLLLTGSSAIQPRAPLSRLTASSLLVCLVTHMPSAHAQQMNDSTVSALIEACDIVYRRASTATDQSIRRAGVDSLARVCRRNSIQATGVALRYLKTFRFTDFTPEAKENVRALMSAQQPFLKEVIMMVSFLQLRDQAPNLRHYSEPGNRTAVRWAAIIGLARMDDNDANQEMMVRVKRLPINDDVVYDIFPDLVFARTREAVSYLVESLYSDVPNCLSPDIEREAMIPCAYRVMEQLAPVVADFPLALDPSGDLITSDYPRALATVRRWFRENPDYKIVRDIY